MRRVSLLYGSIIGALLCVNIVYTVYLCYYRPDFEGNMLLGYALMLLEFSLVYFGIRSYRQKELRGHISWPRAFNVGFLIVMVAGSIYVVVWLFYYYLFVPDFIDKYIAHVLQATAKQGASLKELADKKLELLDFQQKYKNPLFVILATYAEVLPTGTLVALISALLLKKGNPNT